MDELLEQFLIEGRELVAQAHDAVGELGRRGDDRVAIDRLFRATHTLKGSVAIFAMAPAERLLHAAESYLEPLRKGGAAIDLERLDALMAVIDQTDRWIDVMERDSALGPDAGAVADRIISQLAAVDDPLTADEAFEFATTAELARAVETGAGAASWIDALRSRPEFTSVFARSRAAFRYAPDGDCFFRGEDPLAQAEAVPGLLALAMLPAQGDWPALADCEPFRCMTVIEGLSEADPEAVRKAFPLAQDQVQTVSLAEALPLPAPLAADAGAVLRVDAAKLDRLADQSGDLGVAARALLPLVVRARRIDPVLAADLRAAHDAIERATRTLQSSIAQVRLVSLEPVLRRLPRLARETAAALGKSVRFKMSGEAAQVDKQIADQLFEPLMHLVRNAIGHGIETATERAAAGKPPEGEVGLSIGLDGDAIEIVLRDDGRGIDADVIRDSAVAKKLVDREVADELDRDGALRLIFLPGFSTANQVTDVSGRGVGMDAVQTSIERVAGTIAIASDLGQGTRFVLRLPVNAISTSLLVVSAGPEQLGVRLDQIVETARIDAAEIQNIGLGRVCVLRDATLPVLDLAERLGLGETRGEVARLIVTEAGGNRTAIRVDGVGERFDSVVRERSSLLSALPLIAGTALRADGSVLLVLDLPELVA